MSQPPIAIRSALTVETRHGAFSGRRWMDLLAAIGQCESISSAARQVGLSYKAAWDAVEAMNNLSDAPLVERSVGGKGGGGARLTARGQQLVQTYRAVESENARFLERINALIGGADQDLRILERLTMQTSARNHLSGKVVHITAGSVNDEVELQLSGGDRLVAILTHTSVERMGLAVGSEAVALIKASSVIVAVADERPMTLSARNQLAGRVARIQPGAVNTEVVIELAGGVSVAAVITHASAQAMQLAEGTPVIAVFKASSVILAVAA